ncbi:hypothetical protein [Nocardioides sp. GXQ0305]|uniref:hypothetical protein n=1 Tax=Nocardioides sp. GXQ0305 TaxID=3423912 RepID=UPI003D7E65F0
MPELLASGGADSLRLPRAAVRTHAATERRRRYAPLVHVGIPGVRELAVAAHPSATDHGLRCDVLAAMLAATGGPHLAWLTRPGELTLHDVDAVWLSAALAAYAEAGRDLTWVVVTRRGWWDPRSDARRTWRRVRV